jgi:hypothetical protein
MQSGWAESKSCMIRSRDSVPIAENMSAKRVTSLRFCFFGRRSHCLYVSAIIEVFTLVKGNYLGDGDHIYMVALSARIK